VKAGSYARQASGLDTAMAQCVSRQPAELERAFTELPPRGCRCRDTMAGSSVDRSNSTRPTDRKRNIVLASSRYAVRWLGSQDGSSLVGAERCRELDG
jgi:hypothetical protein